MDMKSGNQSRWLAFLFTIIGIAIGASFQYVANLNLEKAKHLEESKKDAYIDFLNAQQKYYEAQSMEDKERAKQILYEHSIESVAAKKRVAIYGGKRVAEAMATFYRTFKLQPCGEDIETDVAIYRNMRAELLSKDEQISDSDLTVLLFNCNY